MLGSKWLLHSKDVFSDCILNIYTAHTTRSGVKIGTLLVSVNFYILKMIRDVCKAFTVYRIVSSLQNSAVLFWVHIILQKFLLRIEN